MSREPSRKSSSALRATTSRSTKTPRLGAMPEWDLSDLYAAPDAPEVQRDLKAAAKEAARIKTAYQGRLADLAKDGGKLAGAIKDYEKLSDLVGKLGSYSGLYYVLDQTDPVRAKFNGDVSEALTKLYTDLIFFELELNQIDDATMDGALKHKDVKRYKPWLEDLRKEKPHQLDEKLERLFTEKSQTSRSAWNRLFDETMSALKFDVKGEKTPLTLEPTLNFLSSPDEKKRKAASEALSKVFKANLPLFTLITNTLAKDKEISDRWRNFKDVADSRNLANRVEGPVVDALVTSVRAAYPQLSHRYYAMKAKWLGKKKLASWDRNAPLPDKPERTITWAEAEKIVLKAYGNFAPEMATIAKQFFDKNWIDAAVKPGKAPGAFSASTVPSVHPYVMMNYLGKPRDVMTLAHELGHGVHQWLARAQGPLLAPTPLTLAETASVFGEMLTFKAILAETKDKRERKAMIAGKVEDMLNTVVRQVAFYTFERKVHEERRQGELTSDRINAIWLEIQGESLGPAIELKPGYEVFWTYVPHFIHSPFYVYAYAFGDCLVNSLYGLYAEAHPGFVAKYFDLLKAGGSKHHSELLAPFGLDARDPEFWNKGLKVIEGMIDELETMA
ncbi:oligoendopeptidase, pepF/M3 family [Hyphomicrobium denitrificans ATCC 51888]|uniref:Oligoendopeptidase, pepF/M3 family n=1 Tax=Hyphomicrobium denitrificans (strain ATCC 51888 / DSM 1869 / NCIMB 11706 / TK 0415) TaxID=582899 RepID=D8JTB3_HYPDA|nr:M3 family oligoendopeptidase [Hyphomicrobium denitrificans]ADJ24431.1 oligoendopeptidase, pepF/M3 family [Hyphomicrobium denitrificans ATCC 51888]